MRPPSLSFEGAIPTAATGESPTSDRRTTMNSTGIRRDQRSALLGRRRPSRLTVNLLAFLVASAVGCAQERTPQSRGQQQPGQSQKAPDNGTADAKSRRLESVTWNSVTHELTWVVSNGEKNSASNGSYKPLSSQTYHINMDEAVMDYQGEKRRFSRQEAENVRVLMDILSKYAIESTVWWEDGQGQKLDNKGNPIPGKQKPAPGSLHAGTAEGELHASFSQPPEENEIRDLRLRVAELEQRLGDLENRQDPQVETPHDAKQAVFSAANR